jgi:hypothetical protein
MRLWVYPAALVDADEAHDWYNQVHAGLGDEFTQEIEHALNVLLRQPNMGSKRYAFLVAGQISVFGVLPSTRR